MRKYKAEFWTLQGKGKKLEWVECECETKAEVLLLARAKLRESGLNDKKYLLNRVWEQE